MKYLYALLGVFGVLLCCIFAAGCVSPSVSDSESAGVTIVQSDGSSVTLPGVADRIVLMNSNAGEMLYVIGAADRVVGASQSIMDHAELGPLFPNAVSVGKWNVPDVETISSLSPDVVVAFASSKPQNADLIESAGIPIVYVDCYKPTTMAQDVRSLGTLTGREDEALRFVEFYEEVVEGVRAAVASASEVPRVYAEGYSDYSGQVNGSGVDLLLDIAGGENVLTQDVGAVSPKVSPEWLVSENPEVIIKVVSVADMEDAAGVFDELVSRQGFASIDAVAENRTILLRNDVAYGPRSFAGAVAVARVLHPEEMAGFDLSVLDRYNSLFGLDVSGGTVVFPEF